MNKFAVWSKRIVMFVAVNILVMATIVAVSHFLNVQRYVPKASMVNLAVMCLIMGFSGALISLALSRVMAKWTMGVQVIPPDTQDPELRDLVGTVHELARRAGLPKMPEVGIYESPELNAFATGPTRSRSLVAVSTGLLRGMNQREVVGVLAHEVAHIANGDMVTSTLVQGVVNSFALFLSHLLASIVSAALRSRDEREERDSGGGGFMYYMMVQLFNMVFMLLGMLVVNAFSRWREFRADAGSARLAGRDNMVMALQALQRHFEPQAVRNDTYATMKINGRSSGLLALFSTHPPIEKRIERLLQSRA